MYGDNKILGIEEKTFNRKPELQKNVKKVEVSGGMCYNTQA